MITLDNCPKELYTTEHLYEKGDPIIPSEEAIGGLVRSGSAMLISIDADGIRRIHSYYSAGDIFLFNSLPSFTFDTPVLSARSRCRIDFIHLNARRSESDGEDLTLDFASLLTEEQRHLLSHIHILEQQSIRKKILAFLELISGGRKSFSVPMTLTDCADYLAVDRSAMMRELSKMQEEGMIRHKGRKFTLM